MALVVALAGLTAYAIYSASGDIAGMGIVAMAAALTKLVEGDE